MNERRKLYVGNKQSKGLDRKTLSLTREIEYRYDYGDEWIISITLEGIFNYHNQTLSLCINADDLPVFDDAGGVYGYIDFLKCIKEDIPSDLNKDKEEAPDFARKFGWTGRMNRPENLLQVKRVEHKFSLFYIILTCFSLIYPSFKAGLSMSTVAICFSLNSFNI